MFQLLTFPDNKGVSGNLDNKGVSGNLCKEKKLYCCWVLHSSLRPRKESQRAKLQSLVPTSNFTVDNHTNMAIAS